MASAEQTTAPGVDEVGGILAELGTGSESTDLQTRQAAALRSFGRRAGANPDRSILVSDAATLLALTFQADFSSVGEVVADGSTLSVKVAKTGEDGKPLDWILHKTSLDATDSMAATALETAQPVVVENLTHHEQFSESALRKVGVVSALTVPLHVDNRPFGTLAVYMTREHPLGEEDVCFVETIAHMLTNSIARKQADENLQNHRKLSSTILSSIDSLVFELDSELKLIAMNRACRTTTGFDLREIVGKAFSSVFVVPEELDLVQGILRNSAGKKKSCKFESFLLTKDSEQHRVEWTLSALCDDNGALKSMVLTGTDRTDIVDAERRLKKAEDLARRSVTQLQKLRQEVAEQIKTSGRPILTDGETREMAPGEAARAAAANLPNLPPGRVPAGESLPKSDSEKDEESAPMVQRPNGTVGPEARTSVRRTFHYKQLIAPMYGGIMPSRKEFFQVTCENISAGGIAFYVEKEPDFDCLVIGLGQSPTLTYFSGRVIRVMKKEFNGKEQYLVGCRFSGRVHL